MKIEIPLMLNENPISWLNPKKHYKKMEEKATNLSDLDLLAIRKNYEHITLYSWTIGALSFPTTLAAWVAVVPHVAPEVAVLSVGLIPTIPSMLGSVRHNFRAGERNILDEELSRRGMVFEKKPNLNTNTLVKA